MRPRASSVRYACSTVETLTPSRSDSPRTEGRRSPGRSAPTRKASSIFPETRSYRRSCCIRAVWREPAQRARPRFCAGHSCTGLHLFRSPCLEVDGATMRPDTLLVHAGEPRPRDGGAVAMPIYQSSTFEETEARGYHDIRYARLSNTPTHEALHAKLAALEEAEAALATASGMAAVSAALLSVLRGGDHVVAQDG